MTLRSPIQRNLASARVRWLPLIVFTAWLAGCASPPVSQKADVAPTVGQAACYQPNCCKDAASLRFEPHRLNCRAIELREQGKDAEALRALQAAASAARAETARREAATEVLCYVLNDLAHRADAAGDDGGSRTLFDDNLAACKRRFGDTSDAAAQALFGGASQHLRRDRLRVALPQMEQVVAMARGNGNRGLESFATDALGRIHDMLGDRAQARRLLQQAIAIKTEVFGARSREVAVSYTNLGASYIETNDGATGRDWYRKAVAIYTETLGAADDKTLNVSSSLAASHLADGELQPAERLYEALYPKFVQTYGATDERTVVIVNDWGAALARQERFADALVKFEQALAVRRGTMANTVRHGNSALNAAKMKKVTTSCAAAQPLRSEATRVAASMSPTQRRDGEVAGFVADVARFEEECAPRRGGAAAPGRKK
jgi:tetratricopeptide (TPR) repeat protein